MLNGKLVNIKSILSLVQWTLSVLAIPTLIWAWNLSTQVQIHKQEIVVLQLSVSKTEAHAVELAKMNTTLDFLKENISDIKSILRD